MTKTMTPPTAAIIATLARHDERAPETSSSLTVRTPGNSPDDRNQTKWRPSTADRSVRWVPGSGNAGSEAATTHTFSARKPYPAQHDMLMDIATEEFSHLEIVGATITMLVDGVNGELKDAAEASPLSKLTKGKAGKEEVLHEALTNPQFLVLSGGGPTLTNSHGVPFSGANIDANRSDRRPPLGHGGRGEGEDRVRVPAQVHR